MTESKISVKYNVESQIPLFMQEEYPLFAPFLKQYYESQENFSEPINIAKNIDSLIKTDNYTSKVLNDSSTVTTEFCDFTDTSIKVESTFGWPDRYGLLKINNEVITYTSITETSFEGCIRGFSGITSYNFSGKQVSYETTENDTHEVGSKVENLSTLFLKEFFRKIKIQFLPGFEDIELYSELDQKNFLIQSKDFYSTKGTPKANNILFKALYGENVKTINPQDYLLKPSANDYRVVNRMVVKPINGNVLDLEGSSIFQEIKTASKTTSSYGSLSNVEIKYFNQELYYVLDIDFGYDRDTRTFGSIYGNFKVHPKTKLVQVNGSDLTVDSTIGFSNSGTLIINETEVTYTDKTNNQFLNCTNVPTSTIGDDIESAEYQSYGLDENGNRIDFRITGVLEKIILNDEEEYYYESGDPILIKSLGLIKDKKDAKFNSWKFNTSTKFNIKSIAPNGQYFVVTSYNDHLLSINDDLQFVNKINSSVINTKVERIISDTKFQVSANLNFSSANTFSNQHFVRRLIKITDSSITKNSFTSDIQNVYDNEGSVVVTSSSLPSYTIRATNRSKSLTLIGLSEVTNFVIPNHQFFTGDVVRLSASQDIFSLGVKNYVVKKIGNDTFKLSLSNSNIKNNLFVTFQNYLEDPVSITVTPIKNVGKSLSSQKIVRRIEEPINSKEQSAETKPQTRVGILMNGVEILNYKGEDVVYYGSIDSIDVLDGGEDYDIINPPVLKILDSTGVGATGTCSVKGSLKEIKVIDGGFGYIDVPSISISGGNGTGVIAEAKMSKIYNEVYFNAIGISTALGGFISTTSNFIGFNTEHKFNNGEEVVYDSFNGTKIGIGTTTGDITTQDYLQDNSIYYISVVNDQSIKIYNNQQDSINQTNEINLTSPGTGNQKFTSLKQKNIISSIQVVNSGNGYENKNRIVNSVGVNTSNSSINIKNHDFKSGEIVTYSTTGNVILGLDTSKNYFVLKLDDDNFRLCSTGIGTTVSKEFYLTNQYINLNSKGSGIHSFNYPPIRVTINGKIGVDRTDTSKFQSIIEPIFRGEITSIQLTNNGTGYGSTDIINFDKQPEISLNSGKNAVVKPIISGEKIKSIIVLNSGSEYNSSPSFKFIGSGSYAKLTPISIDGKLSSVKVENGGVGFRTDNCEITVISSGKNAKFHANIKRWTVNLVEKYKNLFATSDDDGLIVPGIVNELQYVNLFPPRELRKNLFSKNVSGSNNYQNNDLIFNNNEILSTDHSPIIGWSYDGHPIYGPYGYSNPTGGAIKALSPGYELVTQTNRPPGFDPGFFVEDYAFTNSGDLDEHNGRFCKTPDYPNGIYAYFTTINNSLNGYDNSYKKYRRPVFPYVIGNTYKSIPNKFNNLPSSNQSDIDLTSNEYIRNSYPYKLNQEEAECESIIQPQKLTNNLIEVSSSSIGQVESIGITSAGYGYEVGDKISFDNTETDGSGATARISEIFEDRIISLASSITALENVSFNVLTTGGLVEGVSTTPHSLKNLDFVNISGLSSNAYSNLGGFYQINVPSNKFALAVGLGTTGVTGLTTFLYFQNSVDSNVLRENDILKINQPGIGTEKFLVLNVDTTFKKVTVKREYGGKVGLNSVGIGTIVEEDPRRFTYNSGFTTNVSTNSQRKVFFEPQHSVAIGTVGLTTTISISRGSIFVDKIVDLKTIYIPQHKFTTGQKLLYSNEDGNSIVVSSTGIGSTTLSNNSHVYVAKFNDDAIGISTTPIGIGSTGGFVGIGSTANVLYFLTYGTGNFHSFKTQEEQITGKVEKNIATIRTKNNHNLQVGNSVQLEVSPGIATSIVVKYNSANRRLIINPRSFGGSGINTSTSIITIQNHNYSTGDKVIYTTTNPAFGLNQNRIYYIIKIDSNQFRLSDSYYQSITKNSSYVNITSAGSGHEISSINPPLTLIEGNTVIFDLSDSSLADNNGGSLVQAFDFNLYDNSNFSRIFTTSLKSPDFEVTKTGIIGVTNDAKLTLKVTKHIPQKLFYKLTPLIGKTYLTQEKSEIIIDKDVYEFNTLSKIKSKFNGSYEISGVGATSFTFNLKRSVEHNSYTSSNSYIKYKTKEKNILGSISSIDVVFGGRGYKSAPGITSVVSNSGSGAILAAQSSNIGKILKTEIKTPGFEYPSDPTLKPIAQLPQKLKVDELYSIDLVKVTYGGKKYSIPPKLIVIDPISKDIKTECELQPQLSGNVITGVKILTNTNSLFDKPNIVAANNNNGIGVTNISFNSTTKTVTVNLATGFSDAKSWPFALGSKIFIEGIGITSTGAGYNSSDYGYELFTLSGITSNIGGGKGVLQYKLDIEEDPGLFSSTNSIQNGTNSFGRIVPESYLPKFDSTLSSGKSKYNIGEPIYIKNEQVGFVVKWDPVLKLLKINNSSREIKPFEIIRGVNDNRSFVIKNYQSSAKFNIGPYTETKLDYEKDTGKLSTFLQVLQDGDYYQNFSYSLKSKVPIEKWDDKVDELTHTVGFKKFSDLQVESEIAPINPENDLQVLSSETDILVDIIQEKDFDCYEDYAIANESVESFKSSLISNQINFDTLRLLDYTEFVSNRVLKIDDISQYFDDTPNIFEYAVVGTFDLSQYNAAQFYILIKDARYFGEKEIIIVNVVYDGANGYLTAYGRNETVLDLGSFGFRRSGDLGEILFYPTKYEYNSYNLSNISVSLSDLNITGIGTSSLGDVVSFASTAITIPSSSSPTTNTVVSISTNSYSSAKVLLSASSSDGNIQFTEVNITNNGSDVYYEIFGDVDSGDNTPLFGSGVVGEVGVTTAVGKMLITFTPNPNIGVNIRGLSTLIGSTSVTGIGTLVLYKGELTSSYVSIAASTSPTENRVAGFTSDTHEGALYYVQIHDTTNDEIQLSEVVLTNDFDKNPQVSEYAVISSNGTLGSIGAAKSTTETHLTFTPNQNIETQVRVYQKTILISPKQDPIEVDLLSSLIRSDTISLGYEGTQISLTKDFNLSHRSFPIFRKVVDGGSSNVVNISRDTINIPNHFFVTGEKIEYSTNGTRVGIATTTVTGVGSTDFLPNTVYAVKISENLVKFAETPEKALKLKPEVFDITAVGIGSSHVFKSNFKSNSKSLIVIDNVIQNPVVSTAKTTHVKVDTDNVSTISPIEFNDVTGFYAKDLIKIENEFLIITDIGIGGTNKVVCRREQLGTTSGIHSTGAVITKYEGVYNIVDDRIYFVEAPHGDEINSDQNSSFQGRIFLRSFEVGSANTAYSNNYIFDNVSSQFNGLKDTFSLKSNGENINGIVTSNSASAGILLINNVFQKPKYPVAVGQTYSYEVIESSGISNVIFSQNTVGTGPMKFDINSAGVPRGGIIVSVGSTQGYGFQPLVSAGGTAIVSAAGTIQSVSIGNSGSGYRPGIQTSITVSAATSEGRVSIGTATAVNGIIVSIAVTNPGTSYTSTNPPEIIIDAPLNYENIPLRYDSSNSGIGTEATVNIVVGYGNSVIDFTFNNTGYAYTVGNVLTVEIGGSTGIPTNSSLSYRPFQLTVNEVYNDSFNAWYPGQFVVIDDIDNQFDGFKKTFTLKENGVIANFIVRKGSPIQPEQNLLVFINDVLQLPSESYIFDGGSQIEFLEAPKFGDSVKLLFFKGSSTDVVDVNVVPTIKVGDKLKLVDQLNGIRDVYTQDQRIVSELLTVDSVYTTQYFGPGITSDALIERTVEWCKQKEDFYLDSTLISKSRDELNSNIYPVTTAIKSVGIATTSIFVQSVRPLFNYTPEMLATTKHSIKILEQNDRRSAIATAIVSVAGTISNIIIEDGGIGFSTAPEVYISTPRSGSLATASAIVSGLGTISSISITNPGSGYTYSNPPKILIESESYKSETITSVSYEGDEGVISGVGTTSISGITTGITFDLYIPKNSVFRNANEVGTAQTISGIQSSYYFIIYDSVIGSGLTSLNQDDSILGIGTSYINNVYQVHKVEQITGNAVGVGTTSELLRVTTKVSSHSNLTGLGNSEFFGRYSWGRIYNFNRGPAATNFDVDLLNGTAGLSTAPLIIRLNSMRSLYTS